MTLRAANQPCANCPWRRDVPPGEFSRERYEALRASVGQPGAECQIDAPWFACHKSGDGKEIACAGWLAAVGGEHLGVRLAVIGGRLPACALDPKPDWPPLFEDYDELVETQAG